MSTIQPQIFKSNLLIGIGIPVIITVVILALYFTNESMPIWTFLAV